MSKLRVLTFSTLFPSSVRPGHGIFVETRLRELLKSGGGRVARHRAGALVSIDPRALG